MSIDAPSESLVVLALDTPDVKDYVIELASRLSKSLSAELLGVFVENTVLLEHASSRRAREILLTGAVRALDRAALERQLRAQAERARIRFEAASALSGLRHRFEVARGDVIAEPARLASQAEALVVSITQALTGPTFPEALLGRLAGAGPRVVLLAREGWQTGESVAVTVQDVGRDRPAIEAAVRIARSTKSPLRVLLAPGDGEPDLGTIDSVLRAHGGHTAGILRLAESAGAGVARAARACRARLLVIRWPSEESELENLARDFAGALMLVKQ